MGIKSKIEKKIPSLQIGEVILEKINNMSLQINKLQKDVANLDYKNEYLFWLTQSLGQKADVDTKKEIFRQMPKATGKTRIIQLAAVYIMKRMKEICDANGLHFFLMYGTLLGACRHGGFIPWDNDVDVGMTRKDYEKFKAILENDKELAVNNYYDVAWNMKFIKVKLRESNIFYIDIFLFDEIDANESNCKQLWQQTQVLSEEYTRRLGEIFANAGCSKESQKTEQIPEIEAQVEALEQEMFGKSEEYGHGDALCIGIDVPGFCRRSMRKLVLKSDVYPLIRDTLAFEGVYFDVVKNYEQNLSDIYGDFWSLPKDIHVPHEAEFENMQQADVDLLKQKGII